MDQEELCKRHFKSRLRKGGFSLLELVVVVSVLAILSSIASLGIICFVKEAKAKAALAMMKQIQAECLSKIYLGKEQVFVNSSLNGYSIKTSNINSCAGVGSERTIAVVPDDPNELPTFIWSAAQNKITYDFRGKFGENLNDCIGLICKSKALFESIDEPAVSENKHDPYSDPFHGEDCMFRTSMFYADQGFGGRMVTGCYGFDNKFMSDPCGYTQIGCERYSFTGYNTNPLTGRVSTAGNYPCIPGRKSYFYRVPEGWDPVSSSNCEAKSFAKPFEDLDSVWCQRSARCRNFDFSNTPLYVTDDPPLNPQGDDGKNPLEKDDNSGVNSKSKDLPPNGKWRNCYCFPPKDPCLCDDGLPSGPR